ncbi:hypothetical protein KM043_005765 [Ampulex compressa]|nr:hypothetical protein KM043_005765 [Ampulex compressa]
MFTIIRSRGSWIEACVDLSSGYFPLRSAILARRKCDGTDTDYVMSPKQHVPRVVVGRGLNEWAHEDADTTRPPPRTKAHRGEVIAPAPPARHNTRPDRYEEPRRTYHRNVLDASLEIAGPPSLLPAHRLFRICNSCP